MLVCLDNCEHVLDGAADVVATLLELCPNVHVLTTSREPLGIGGETVWRVPPLAREDALALFVDRAQQVNPSFVLDGTSEPVVRRLCSRLDGIPLAVELAAAWLRTLTPQEVEAGLDDRFTLLVRGTRGAVARQRTLAASIDWSHALLAESDRRVFRRLAVFPGTFDLDAARSVTDEGDRAAALAAVGRLVDKSLVVAEQRDGATRYRLLETIRHYAADRLCEAGEADAAHDRHLEHFLAFVEAIDAERLSDIDAWRARLEREHDNVRAAVEWGLSRLDPQRGRRLAAALGWWWHLHRHGRDGIAYLQRAVQRAPDDRSTLQAQLLTAVALVADTQDPLDLELDAAQRALEIATERGDDGLRALCLALSAVGQFYTDFDAAWRLAGDARAAAERAADPLVADAARALHGIILHLRDRHGEAEPLLRAASDGLRRRHRGIAATALGFRAAGVLYTGEVDRARALAEQAVLLADPLADYLRVGSARGVLALVHGLSGNLTAAFEVMQPVLRLLDGAGREAFVPGLGFTMGTLHLRADAPEEAVRWLEPEAVSTAVGSDTWLGAQASAQLGAAYRLLGRVDDAHAALARALAIGRRLEMPRVVATALEQQAHLLAADDEEKARTLHHEALAMRVECGLHMFVTDSLEALAALLARAQASIEAARLLAAAEAARTASGYPLDPASSRVVEVTRSRLRAELGAGRFAAAWAEGARLTLDQAAAYVRRSRGTRGRAKRGWDSLTPTELDVVRLAAEGLTNPEIASRLFVSRTTVKTHLAHVYAKLGVANRTELTAVAARRRR